MMRSNIVLLIAAMLILGSCEKDIKLNAPGQEAKLVFYSVSYPGDTIRLALRSTVNVLQYKQQPLNVSNATVVLYDNGSADTLQYDPALESYVSKTIVQDGHNYRLSAMAPGFPAAEASTDVPQPVSMQVTVTPNARISNYGTPLAEVRVQFKDPANPPPDYYRLAIAQFLVLGNSSHYINGCLDVNDPALEQLREMEIEETPCYDGSNMYLTDLLFNGRDKEMWLYIGHNELLPYNNGIDSMHTTITLEHYNETYFRYLRSYEYLRYNEGNPFSEPTNVASNVKNGHGIFAIINRDIYEVR
jgi:hypothetical protein